MWHGVTLAHCPEVDVERVPAFIGLGANVGDARRTLTDAVPALARIPGARLGGVSRLYRTKPVGVTDQPDFLNAVVRLAVPAGSDPAAGAIDLLVELKNLERAFGRQQRGRWQERELDLDLLLFGGHRIAVERPEEARPATAAIDPGAAARLLEVPHPQMRDRLFVLAPLADLAPDVVPPGWDETVEVARDRQVALEESDAVRAIAGWSEDEQAWIGPSGKPIEIRPALPDDAEAAARAHTASAEAAYRDVMPPEPDGLTRRIGNWRRSLANPEIEGYIAVDDGRVVGVLNIGQFRDQPGLGAVRLLYVRPEWWGSGAGQMLMDHAHRELAKAFDEATLTVLTANARARRFYERNGWVEGETLMEPHFGDRMTRVTRYRRRLR
jgi:2-amino-4-hydroxy-6-hydroxymethyldihydropteridine diphosphokinase